MPVIGTLWNRLGGVPAHPDNAYRLLHEQRPARAGLPRGVEGPAKTFNERYQLRRFGRGGFVEIAMPAGVPIVPIAVVGAEESMPILFGSPRSRGPRAPVLPVTANMASARSGAVVHFPAKFKLRSSIP